jgi:hypothetical protein
VVVDRYAGGMDHDSARSVDDHRNDRAQQRRQRARIARDPRRARVALLRDPTQRRLHARRAQHELTVLELLERAIGELETTVRALVREERVVDRDGAQHVGDDRIAFRSDRIARRIGLEREARWHWARGQQLKCHAAQRKPLAVRARHTIGGSHTMSSRPAETIERKH